MTEKSLRRGILSPEGNLACVIHRDVTYGRSYRLWNLDATSSEFQNYRRLEHDSPLIWGQFRENDENVITSSEDRLLRYGDRMVGKIYPLNFQNSIRRFFLSPSEQSLFTMHGKAGKIACWNPPTLWNFEPFYLKKNPQSLTISSNGEARK